MPVSDWLRALCARLEDNHERGDSSLQWPGYTHAVQFQDHLRRQNPGGGEWAE